MARILIIDDDVRICRLMAKTLVGAGHEVIEAFDGDEGLRLFRDRHPAIVITDILLPKRDGIATILELRREAPAIAIIAISGGGYGYGVDYLDFAGKLGADRVLPKPFKLAELVDVVNDLLST
jgi:DNA-binding response OmpR family regulator